VVSTFRCQEAVMWLLSRDCHVARGFDVAKLYFEHVIAVTRL
jgi:hypothetical protein